MSDAVVVLEDDPVVRRGVVRQIEASARFSVAAEAGDVAAARRAIETASAAVGVFDLELRDGSALPLIPVAVARGMSVLVLTIWDDDERVYQALAAGAGGYLLKGDASAGRVAESLGVLVEGGAPISPTIARRLLDDLRLRAPKAPARAPTPDVALLTDREREIIELFAKGATYDEVASLLTLSVNTVRHHVRSMYRKLHVCSKTEAVTLAFPRA
ncbi:MAG: response regulator transcription factor [Labilithrix sp.]|nr:response regulator transcription factor [Labilithrix sp.]MCW5837627.1 response regulator transcription factor [Labilithrix sp.]